METKTELLSLIMIELSNLKLDIDYQEDLVIEAIENCNSSDEFQSELWQVLQDNNLTDVEIIYYASAIDYLKENDPSLQKSFEIAKEYGFLIEKLNSEVLASLLATRQLEESYHDSDFSDIEELVSEYLNNEEEEEM